MAWLHPSYLWTLAAVPLVAALFVWAAWRRREALRRFGDHLLVARLAARVSPRRRRWKSALLVLSVALLALALAGPRVGTQLREAKREGVDLVIALDVSLSMTAEDVAPSRLARARNEIRKLLDTMRGDRVGLVVFAGDAFLQCPLTTDYGALKLFLDVADPELMPTQGTNFAAALRVALQAFDAPQQDPQEEGSRALLIVSDGENHTADIDAVVEEARRQGVVIYTAGVGETTGAPIPLYRGSARAGYKRDQEGEIVQTRLEEEALQSLATDGAYFRIGRTASTLPQLRAALDRLERTEFASERFEAYEERYQWPLLAALLLLIAELLVSERRRARAHRPDPTYADTAAPVA